MKKFLYLLSITASSLLFGQIELQKTIDEEVSAYSTNGETYYVTSGYFSNQESENVKAIKIFDKNFNLYKQFDVNVPTGYRLIISKPNEAVNSFILSKGIFDLDDKLDIIMFFDKYYEGVIIKIFNEDGVIVKDFNKTFSYYTTPDSFQVFHDETENINKLLINSLGDKDNNIKTYTDIYTLPSKTLSVNDNNTVPNSLKIYPNPVNSVLTIDNPNNGNTEAKVFDMTGRLIKTITFYNNDKSISLNVSDLIKGNYIVKIGNSVSKIIKN
mgnify:CR=1 FL=1